MFRIRRKFDRNISSRDLGFRRSEFIEPRPLGTFSFSLILLTCFIAIPALMVCEAICLRYGPRDTNIVRSATMGLALAPLAIAGIISHRRWRNTSMTLLVALLFLSIICVSFGYISMQAIAAWITRKVDALAS